jgi:hypothetical protein
MHEFSLWFEVRLKFILLSLLVSSVKELLQYKVNEL